MKKSFLIAALVTLPLFLPQAWAEETHHTDKDKKPASSPSAMPTANTSNSSMQQASGESHDMKKLMTKGMDSMQTMQMSGDMDKDFAMMMKMHHQQALDMAQMEIAHGKSPEMKAMAKKIVAAQKKEIARFDKWLAKH